MLEMNFKKKFTPFADKHSNADPTRGQQRAARSQQSCRRRQSWGNRGEEKKPARFGACTPPLLHIHVSSHQPQLAPIAPPFSLCTNPGVFHPRAPLSLLPAALFHGWKLLRLGPYGKLSCRQGLTHPEQRALQKSHKLHQPKYNPSSSTSRITSNVEVSELPADQGICTKTAKCENTYYKQQCF